MQPAAFFILPRGWKRSFHQFLTFQGVGNAVFANFWLSKGLEMQFLPISDFPRGWKCSFRQFLTFGRGRKRIFAVFYSSAMTKSRFLAFFDFQPRPTSKIINLGDYWAVHSRNPKLRG